MIVCEFCGDEDIMYTDPDDSQAYCEDCYEQLDKEYIEWNDIKKI